LVDDKHDFCFTHFCTTNYWKQKQINNDQTSPKPFSPKRTSLIVFRLLLGSCVFQTIGQWCSRQAVWISGISITIGDRCLHVILPGFVAGNTNRKHKVSDFDFPKHQRLKHIF
jgi:hypothetical protein